MKDKRSLYQTALEEVGSGAKLQINESSSAPETKRATRTKTLKSVPTSYFEAHDMLRSQNRTYLDFSSYIMEALREKLERDGAL